MGASKGNSSKLTPKLKGVMYKKLCEATVTKLTADQFNSLYVVLEQINTQYRIVPHGAFENDEYMLNLEKTKAGIVFKKWVTQTHANVQKDSNKGRKFRREIVDFVKRFGDTLPYSMWLPNIFTASLVSLFMEDITDYGSVIDVERSDDLNDGLDTMRNFLASIFFVELVSSPIMAETLIGVFMQYDGQELVKRVLELGSLYDLKVQAAEA